MNKKIKIIPLVICGIMLTTGCDNPIKEKEAPKCAANETKKEVMEIYKKYMAEKNEGKDIINKAMSQNLPKEMKSISKARAVKYDEKIMLRHCVAQAEFKGIVEGNTSIPIEYTTQIGGESGNQVFIELNFDFVKDFVKKDLFNQIKGWMTQIQDLEK